MPKVRCKQLSEQGIRRIVDNFTEFNNLKKNTINEMTWNATCYTAQMQVMHTSPCYKNIILSDSFI